MSTGLLALLDDVAALVKVSAATLDDVPAQIAKSTGKVSGIVIDDAYGWGVSHGPSSGSGTLDGLDRTICGLR